MKQGSESTFQKVQSDPCFYPLRYASGEESYHYDGHGRRVSAFSPNPERIEIRSVYGLDGVLRYQQDFRKNKVINYIHLAGSLVGTRETPIGTVNHVVTYQHTDALGSPVAVTNQAGQVIDRTHYEPYGAAIGKAVAGVGYIGHVMDAATGLTYMQQRYYDPTIGRFLSVDPVTANSGTGANFNRYWYANNNPYKFTDPDGRDAFLFTDRNILVIPVHFTGSAATPGNIARIKAGVDALKSEWGTMRVVLQVLQSPGGAGTNRMDLSPGLDYRTFEKVGEGVIELGGNSGHIDSSRANWIGATVHDIMHFAGAPDGYREVGGSRENRRNEYLSGYSSNHIMADRSGNTLTARDVAGIENNESTRQMRLSDFQGVFRVEGRIDSKRLDKELSK